MEEKTLFYAALFSSITGILILLILSYTLEYPLTAVADIHEDVLGKTVLVEGEVLSLRKTPQASLFEIQDETGRISILVSGGDPLALAEGASVQVLGQVSEYQGAFEIHATKITML